MKTLEQKLNDISPERQEKIGVRDNFKKRVVDRLGEFGHKSGFICEHDDETGGLHCRLEE